MRVKVFAVVAALATLVSATAAEAKRHRPAQQADRGLEDGASENLSRRHISRSDDEGPSERRARQAAVTGDDDRYTERRARRAVAAAASSEDTSDRSALGGRPSRWCGWWMRTQRGGGPEMNVAWNWSRYGSAASPQVGAVVVWPHHVGEIVGQAANGQWIVKSGNDGGRVRERARSISGAVIRM